MASKTVAGKRLRHVPQPGKGNDHIYFSTRADGTKVYEVRLPGAKRVYETVGTRLDEAKARARVAWGATNPDPVASVGTRLADVVVHWQAHRNMRPRSAETFDAIYRIHIEPRFGSTKVRELDKFVIQTWLGNLKRRDGRDGELATGTRRLIHATLEMLLRHAVEMGVIASVPKIDRKMKPKASEGRTRVLTDDELYLLISAAETRPWLQDVIRVAVAQGLRLGEVCGLKWTDVDFVANTITVQHNLGRDGNIGPTKGGRADVIDLMPQAREVLVRLKLASGGADLVFTNRDGNPRQLRDVQRGFALAVQRAGLKEGVVFHTLRHTCASKLANHPGIVLVDVRDFMRHTDLAITQGYMHSIPSESKKALLAEALAL
ncbi:MAG TPA: tyrosine-type recombinase/integrase [Gaiellaceae bacterium]|nr:tyrosine-type recombinase/integrase [Gaiellaceae bacterium]